MSYASLEFVFFILAFFGLYALTGSRTKPKQGIILVFNLIFYYLLSGFTGLLICVLTAIFVFLIAGKIGRIYEKYESDTADMLPKDKRAAFPEYKKRSAPYMWLGIIAVVGFLVLIKIFSLSKSKLGIIAPIGLSYYTFSCTGYILDVYRNKIKPEKNPLVFLSAVTFFPHIVQGPICRYNKLTTRLNSLEKIQYDNLKSAFPRILLGFFKKLVIADRLAILRNAVFGSLSDFGGRWVLLAVAFDAFMIYADFSGCMDIALGVSKAIGIELEENFRQPFFSRTAAEFWRRWHITLGAWFKDYVYMPLAMSPKMIQTTGKLKQKGKTTLSKAFSTGIPLMVVWILTGLWHGTGADYICWGLYWGLIISLSAVFATQLTQIGRDFDKKVGVHTGSVLRALRTFLIFVGGRCMTATGSPKGFFQIPAKIFSPTTAGKHIAMGTADYIIAALGILFIMAMDALGQHKKTDTLVISNTFLRNFLYFAVIIFIFLFGIYGIGYDASSFIYGAY